MAASPLSKIAVTFTGTNPSPPRGPEAICYIQIKDLQPGRRLLARAERPTVKRAEPARTGDILLAARGERALAVPVDGELEDAYPSLDVYLIRPDPARLDTSYLIAFLSLAEVSAELKASTAGSLVPRIPKSALDNLKVPLPPLEQQRRIGAFASAIRAERALTAALESARSSLRESQLAAAFALLK